MADENPMEVFEYDPENGDAEPLRAVETAEVKYVYRNTALACETFNAKLYTRASEDEKASEHVQFVEESFATEGNGTRKFESPHERLARVKAELAHFTKQLDSLSTADAIEEISTGKVLQSIGDMETDFGAILNDSRISPYLTNDAPFAKGTLNRPDSEITDALISQLGSQGGKGLKGVSYELVHRKKAGDKELRLNEVERRIGSLEKKVGTLGKEDGFENLSKGLGDLYNKLELLQGSNIDGLTRRIASTNAELQLQQHLMRIKGAKGGEKLVDKLHETFEAGDKSIKAIPNIILGLQSSDERHRSQVDAVLRLQSLQRMQLGLNSVLKDDKAALETVSANMAENVKVLKGNIANFKQRFTDLNKKLDQL